MWSEIDRAPAIWESPMCLPRKRGSIPSPSMCSWHKHMVEQNFDIPAVNQAVSTVSDWALWPIRSDITPLTVCGFLLIILHLCYTLATWLSFSFEYIKLLSPFTPVYIYYILHTHIMLCSVFIFRMCVFLTSRRVLDI